MTPTPAPFSEKKDRRKLARDFGLVVGLGEWFGCNCVKSIGYTGIKPINHQTAKIHTHVHAGAYVRAGTHARIGAPFWRFDGLMKMKIVKICMYFIWLIIKPCIKPLTNRNDWRFGLPKKIKYWGENR